MPEAETGDETCDVCVPPYMDDVSEGDVKELARTLETAAAMESLDMEYGWCRPSELKRLGNALEETHELDAVQIDLYFHALGCMPHLKESGNLFIRSKDTEAWEDTNSDQAALDEMKLKIAACVRSATGRIYMPMYSKKNHWSLWEINVERLTVKQFTFFQTKPVDPAVPTKLADFLALFGKWKNSTEGLETKSLPRAANCGVRVCLAARLLAEATDWRVLEDVNLSSVALRCSIVRDILKLAGVSTIGGSTTSSPFTSRALSISAAGMTSSGTVVGSSAATAIEVQEDDDVDNSPKCSFDTMCVSSQSTTASQCCECMDDEGVGPPAAVSCHLCTIQYGNSDKYEASSSYRICYACYLRDNDSEKLLDRDAGEVNSEGSSAPSTSDSKQQR